MIEEDMSLGGLGIGDLVGWCQSGQLQVGVEGKGKGLVLANLSSSYFRVLASG